MPQPPFGEPGVRPKIVCVSFTTNPFPIGGLFSTTSFRLRACFKIARGPAARDFGRGRDGEARASPLWAVRAEPTKSPGKRPAARRVFEEKAAWLRCSLGHSPLWG